MQMLDLLSVLVAMTTLALKHFTDFDWLSRTEPMRSKVLKKHQKLTRLFQMTTARVHNAVWETWLIWSQTQKTADSKDVYDNITLFTPLVMSFTVFNFQPLRTRRKMFQDLTQVQLVYICHGFKFQMNHECCITKWT